MKKIRLKFKNFIMKLLLIFLIDFKHFLRTINKI